MTHPASPPRFVESIASELDLALGLALAEGLRGVLPAYAELARTLPPDWLADGQGLLGRLSTDLTGVLVRLAVLAGVEEEPDYAACTLRLRDLAPDDVVPAAEAAAARAGLPLRPVDTPEAALVALTDALRAPAGLVSSRTGAEMLAREAAFTLRILRGGPDHGRFWHWVDRFYYERYRAFRFSRADHMAAERARAAEALALPPDPGAPLPLAWLPVQNPMRHPGAFHDALLAGRLTPLLWLEPFGLWDFAEPLPGGCLFSFGRPGEAFAEFRRLADDLATRLRALADPTRLVMLRFVRQLEVDNSDMAAYLELSNPTISVHAKVLREAGLIETRRRGRSTVHDLHEDGLRALLRELESFLGVPPDR